MHKESFISHEAYLKLYQLAGVPEDEYDVILLDEAQDTAPSNSPFPNSPLFCLTLKLLLQSFESFLKLSFWPGTLLNGAWLPLILSIYGFLGNLNFMQTTEVHASYTISTVL